MRSRLFVSLLALSAALAAGPSLAQGYGRAPVDDPMTTASNARPNYGGGFIELLMTGRDPTPSRGGVVYNRPGYSAYGQSARPAAGYEVDPFEQAAGRGRGGVNADGRVAALGQPLEMERPIERMIDPRFRKQEVAYDGPHKPGTIIIDTPQRFLFLVQPNGRALRYGIGVGPPGFSWGGMKTGSPKAEMPNWKPPPEMLKRRPDLPRFMPGGPENPMGARALYLGSSLYRIHGTNEPHTIGQAVSSGCIRMTNDDVTDLYERVRVGAKVLVI